MHQPTFVNLIRDPISWFQSHYTFMRFGMNKGRAEDAPKLGSVSNFVIFQWNIEWLFLAISVANSNMFQDIDDCIKNKEKNCVSNQWTYIEFFCGSEKLCAT